MAQTLNHSPAEIVQQLLIDLGLGTDPDTRPLGNWPVYASNEPDLPDNCITVYDTTGQDDGRSMIDGEVWRHYGLQVRVRSIDHPTGWLRMDAIQTDLAKAVYDDSVAIDASTYLVHCAAKIGDIIALGKDAPTTKRSLFTLNFLLSVKET